MLFNTSLNSNLDLGNIGKVTNSLTHSYFPPPSLSFHYLSKFINCTGGSYLVQLEIRTCSANIPSSQWRSTLNTYLWAETPVFNITDVFKPFICANVIVWQSVGFIIRYVLPTHKFENDLCLTALLYGKSNSESTSAPWKMFSTSRRMTEALCFVFSKKTVDVTPLISWLK